MANTEKISVTLSPDLAQSVNDAVSTGRYASPSEVVRAALLNWQTLEPNQLGEVERLKNAWQAGVASGASEPFDMDKIKADARARLPIGR
jgi:antitoxin ParD1/3/4